MCMRLNGKTKLKIVVAYPPTTQSTEKKLKFYCSLEKAKAQCTSQSFLIVMRMKKKNIEKFDKFRQRTGNEGEKS